MTKDLPTHLEDRHADGERLYSPSAARNREVIAKQLSAYLNEGSRVLEIAAGTGEHAVAVCAERPDITWQPSDPNPQSRESQNAWRMERPHQIKSSMLIDTMQSDWWSGLGTFDAVFCANMIHIAPWAAATGLVEGTKHVLSKSGDVFLYGPFLEGKDTAPSNLKFDQSLKSRNPEWGVRSLEDVKHIFADAGFNMRARIVMPSNNRLIVFSRQQ